MLCKKPVNDYGHVHLGCFLAFDKAGEQSASMI